VGASLVTPTHLIFLLVVGLLLFGAKRLPEVGRSLGSGMREFKDSVSGLNEPEPAVHMAELDVPSVEAPREP
jgi:sec-independent protein translocase protein TatA